PTIVVGERELAMACTDERGLFEAEIDGVSPPVQYLVRDPSSDVAVADPYAFLPTIGELDVHLFAEGRHRQLGRVLGAHRRETNGEPGIAFSVWAPSARGVSVAGDFNGWDSRSLPMRSLGSSGLWELFVPGAQVGDRYKYAVHARDGTVRLHADPVAARTE